MMEAVFGAVVCPPAASVFGRDCKPLVPLGQPLWAVSPQKRPYWLAGSHWKALVSWRHEKVAALLRCCWRWAGRSHSRRGSQAQTAEGRDRDSLGFGTRSKASDWLWQQTGWGSGTWPILGPFRSPPASWTSPTRNQSPRNTCCRRRDFVSSAQDVHGLTLLIKLGSLFYYYY